MRKAATLLWPIPVAAALALLRADIFIGAFWLILVMVYLGYGLWAALHNLLGPTNAPVPTQEEKRAFNERERSQEYFRYSESVQRRRITEELGEK